MPAHLGQISDKFLNQLGGLNPSFCLAEYQVLVEAALKAHGAIKSGRYRLHLVRKLVEVLLVKVQEEQAGFPFGGVQVYLTELNIEVIGSSTNIIWIPRTITVQTQGTPRSTRSPKYKHSSQPDKTVYDDNLSAKGLSFHRLEETKGSGSFVSAVVATLAVAAALILVLLDGDQPLQPQPPLLQAISDPQKVRPAGGSTPVPNPPASTPTSAQAASPEVQKSPASAPVNSTKSTPVETVKGVVDKIVGD